MLLVENIIGGVSTWSMWNAGGGPQLLWFFIYVIVFGAILGIVARKVPIPQFLIKPLVVVGLLAIISFWVKSH